MQRGKKVLERVFNAEFDLLKFKKVKSMVWSRLFQFALIAPNFFLLEVIIITGILGTSFSSKNFSTIFVWYIWWPVLVILMLPFASRIWCSMCPIPAAGEWLQRGALIAKSEGTFGLSRSWPEKLKGAWIGLFIFAFISVFHSVFVSRSLATGLLMLGLLLTALIVHLAFEKRTWCRYLCPIGCFLGLYSLVSSLEFRVRDPDACVEIGQSKPLPCVEGTKEGYGCPWFENPACMERNNYCGLCMECVKTCPYNVSLNIRFFGKDLLVEDGRNFTEAWTSLTLLALGLFAVAIESGPLMKMKPWALMTSGTSDFMLYSAIHLGLTLLPAQAIFFGMVLFSKLASGSGKTSPKKMFTHYAYSLVPLGLAVWICFSLPIILIGMPRAISAVSDPLGWGWNLLGTRDFTWYIPYRSFTPHLQSAISVVASLFSLFIGYKISLQLFLDKWRALRGFIPMAIFILGATGLSVLIYTW